MGVPPCSGPVDESDFYDWLAESWTDALNTAAARVVELLGPYVSTAPDVAALRDLIEDAHLADDPDWRFDSSALIDRLLTLTVGPLTDDAYQRLAEQLDDVFPITT